MRAPTVTDPLRSGGPPAAAIPAYLSPASSRGPSLDLSLRSGTGSNPFRDPSLDLSSRDPSFDSSFRSIHSGSPSHSPPALADPSQPPPIARRPSEVSRQLADAFTEDLPRVSEESSPPPRPSSSASKEPRTGLWSQFRTGSGWFAPLVEPEAPMTREEREAAERERIDKLKEGRGSTSSRRPGLMKRMSSGVEMGFARSRSGSTITRTPSSRENVEGLEDRQDETYLCSIASLGSTAMTDYLTQLPAELFLTICELAYKPRGPYFGLVSKAFLPIARRLAFRNIRVTTYERLTKLCAVVAASGAVGEFIGELELDFEFDEDQGLPKAGTLSTFFRRLSRLDKLKVMGSSRIAKFVVAPPGSSAGLPSLYELTIVDPLAGLDSIGRYRAAKAPVLFGWLSWLGLTGHLHGNPAVPDLLSAFSAVYGLSLHDESDADGATLPALLQAVHDPAVVSTLSLKQAAADPVPLVKEIARFPALEGLELRNGTWSSQLRDTLSRLEHLKALYIFGGAGVSAADLRSMLTGPAKLNKLEKIYLHVLDWDGDVEEYIGWTRSFTLYGVVNLLDVARAADVELHGVAVKLAEDEVEHCKTCVGCRAKLEATRGRAAA